MFLIERIESPELVIYSQFVMALVPFESHFIELCRAFEQLPIKESKVVEARKINRKNPHLMLRVTCKEAFKEGVF